MSSLKLLLCLFILHLSHKVSAFPGFYDINDPSIPKKVQEATQSVYKIISQGGDVDFVLNMKDSQLVESKLSQIIKEDRWFEKMQVDQCFKEHNSICPVFKQVGEGSAFLLHNQVSIYTNLHNFYETLSEQIKSLKSNDRAKIKSVLFNFPLFVKMVNQNKKPLFDLNTDTAYLNLSNPDFRLYDGKKDSMINDLGRLSDIIELNLTHKIESSPLQISQNPIQKDETLYIIGFPSKTTTRKTLFSAPDSDGESMYISKGKPLTVKSWEERIQ
ncbi:MAG TPA: hypothetical protein PLJ21_03345, partial [Pseudobdellovibrionaceae bacterium]|nr:hypothetical protein [Pseudobdellovibrionaceae bacterium]